MNRQDKWKIGQLVGRGIEWTSPYGVRPGYTWNPIKGCLHECQWRMPDGSLAECYAKSVANRLAARAYPNGFAHLSFDEKELLEVDKLKTPSGVFCDSMSDLAGADVPAVWIEQVIEVVRRNPQHIFFLLTKNPPRLKQFLWPENMWIGVSAPPTFMFGNALSIEQQTRWYDKALTTLGKMNVPIRWTSVEPLSWDVSKLLEKHWNHFEWMVVGAASNGAKTYQPDKAIFEKVYKAAGGKPVFLKGNIDKALANRVCGHWLEEWPMVMSDWKDKRHAR